MKETQVRQSFLGPESDEVLAAARVGVIGAGGGGSHVVQQLAHVGVGHLLIVDSDVVEKSNLNRLVGATMEDAIAETPKVDVMARLVRGVNPEAKLRPVPQPWQECHHLLRDCDVVVGCVDGYRTRGELEAVCRRFLVPYVDVGMDVHERGARYSIAGQVIASLPGSLCMRCLGFLNDHVLTLEDQQYGAAGGRPQVVWPNGLLASVAVGMVVGLLCPWSDTNPAIYVDYEGETPSVTVHNRLRAVQGRRCTHFGDPNALGDAVFIP